MLDIIGLIFVCIAFPTIVFAGNKFKKVDKESPIYRKLLIGLTLFFLGCELLRFFYVASFYEGGITPSEDMAYSYITLSLIICLFATFNKGKIGEIARGIFCLTCLVSVVLGIFDSEIYINSLDTYAVAKAMYFLGAGAAITIAIIFMQNYKISVWDNLWAVIALGIFVLLDYLVIIFWGTRDGVDLMWGIEMIVSLVSIGVVYGVNILIRYIASKKDEKIEEVIE